MWKKGFKKITSNICVCIWFSLNCCEATLHFVSCTSIKDAAVQYVIDPCRKRVESRGSHIVCSQVSDRYGSLNNCV